MTSLLPTMIALAFLTTLTVGCARGSSEEEKPASLPALDQLDKTKDKVKKIEAIRKQQEESVGEPSPP